MDVITLIPSNLGILVAALYTLGVGFKKMDLFPSKYIPLGLLLMSIIFSPCLIGFSAEAILQGILCWGVSIGIHQTVKQLNK